MPIEIKVILKAFIKVLILIICMTACAYISRHPESAGKWCAKFQNSYNKTVDK